MKFRVLDFETTGLPPAASVVEVGFTDVEWDPSAISATLSPTNSLLVQPLHRIELEAMAVHHITEHHIKDKPLCTQALQTLQKHATMQGVDVWVAHNARFERHFFNPPQSRWIDTLAVGRKLWPGSPSHKNQVLRYFLNLQVDPFRSEPSHRAGPDSYITALILIEALKLVPVEEMLDITEQPVIMDTVPFGKHKGKKWAEVPRDYLQWLLTQDTIRPDVKSTCEHYLNRSGTKA